VYRRGHLSDSEALSVYAACRRNGLDKVVRVTTEVLENWHATALPKANAESQGSCAVGWCSGLRIPFPFLGRDEPHRTQ